MHECTSVRFYNICKSFASNSVYSHTKSARDKVWEWIPVSTAPAVYFLSPGCMSTHNVMVMEELVLVLEMCAPLITRSSNVLSQCVLCRWQCFWYLWSEQHATQRTNRHHVRRGSIHINDNPFPLIYSLLHSGQFCPIHLDVLGAQGTCSMLYVSNVHQTDSSYHSLSQRGKLED